MIGFSVSNLQKICEIFPASRILVVTDTDNEKTLQILELGITHFISKFCSKEELLNSISSIEKNENYLSENVLDILLKKNQVKTKLTDVKVHLTVKELVIIKLLTKGFSTKDIAKQEFLSVHTINTHRKNILKKLDFKNTSELIMYAVKTGIVDTTEYYI